MTPAELADNLFDLRRQALELLCDELMSEHLLSRIECVQAHRVRATHAWAVSIWLVDGRQFWFEDAVRAGVILLIRDAMEEIKLELKEMVES